LLTRRRFDSFFRFDSQIVFEFRESFFAIFNLFVVAAAECMETFLFCSNCLSPVGFPHKENCLVASMSPRSLWKKTKYDDKFITFGMNFFFDELIKPTIRKNILAQITTSCHKNCQVQCPKITFNPSRDIWPLFWARSEQEKRQICDKKVGYKKQDLQLNRHPGLFSPSVFSQTSEDAQLPKRCLETTSSDGRHDDVNN
jgi:hypothetical protein